MFEKKNEEKRNVLWRTAMTVSSILLILIVVYFLIRMFTANPLEGTWVCEDSDMVLTVGRKDTASVKWPEKLGESEYAVKLEYSVDMETKTLILKEDEKAAAESVEQSEGELTEQMVKSVTEALEGSYEYSIENNQLTLTDREYGEQLVFDKK